MDDTAHYTVAVDVRYILLARGGYTPVKAEVPFLLIIVEPELARTLRSGGEAPDGSHPHPAMELRPAGAVAGQPAASLGLAGGQVE